MANKQLDGTAGKPTTVRIPDQLRADLDKFCATEGISLSRAVTIAVDHLLAANQAHRLRRFYVE